MTRGNFTFHACRAVAHWRRRVARPARSIETRSLPALARCFLRSFPLIARTAHVLTPATLAALPSTRAIPDRDVFYVACPARSILTPYLDSLSTRFQPLIIERNPSFRLTPYRTSLFFAEEYFVCLWKILFDVWLGI
jgi:hypothetical protein